MASGTPSAAPSQAADDGDEVWDAMERQRELAEADGLEPPEMPPPSPPAPGEVNFVKADEMRVALVQLIANRDLDKVTVGGIRGELVLHLGLAEGSLEGQREVIEGVVKEVICAISSHSICAPHQLEEALSDERATAVKKVYLVTLSHPTETHAKCGAPLRPPGEFTHEQIRDALLAAMQGQPGAKISPLSFERMAVFRELHASGEAWPQCSFYMSSS